MVYDILEVAHVQHPRSGPDAHVDDLSFALVERPEDSPDDKPWAPTAVRELHLVQDALEVLTLVGGLLVQRGLTISPKSSIIAPSAGWAWRLHEAACSLHIPLQWGRVW